MKKLLLPIIFYLLLYSVAFGQKFDIYVCDGGNFNNPPWQILKFDENGENHEVYINQELSWPQDIVFIENQNVVLISNLNTGRITKYNADSGQYIDNFATGIAGPTRMEIGSDSLLYVLQWGTSGAVLRYELDGTFAGEYTNTGVTNSIGLDWDTDGNLYVSSYSGNFIRKYDENGIDQGNFISSGLQGPTNIWFDENGDLFVNNWNGTTVKRFDSEGNFIEDFITGLSNPEGIAIFPNGNILIGNGGTSAVKLFDSEGNFIEDIVPSGTGNLLLPNAVVLRENTTVATNDPLAEANFLLNTLGTSFLLNPKFDEKIVDLEVFNLSGQLVMREVVREGIVWNAGNHTDGIYLIKVASESGAYYIQRVVVKK